MRTNVIDTQADYFLTAGFFAGAFLTAVFAGVLAVVFLVAAAFATGALTAVTLGAATLGFAVVFGFATTLA